MQILSSKTLITLTLSTFIGVVACSDDDDDTPPANNVVNNNGGGNNNGGSNNNNTAGPNFGTAFVEEDGDAFSIADWFTADDTNNAETANLMLTDPTGTLPNFAPMTGSPLMGAGMTPPVGDGFFDMVDYVGAVGGGSDWTRGWTILDDQTMPGTGVSANLPAEITCANGVCNVPAGTYTADMTWGPDNVFVISVPGDQVANVVIDGGSTLTVLPGTTVRASGRTAIVVAQGAKIMADGTAESPITFTSDNQTRGAWGGIIINGNAPVNCGAPCSGEGSSGDYGGDMADDDSGVLRYVRIRYAGVRITDEDEFNGLALQGVGSATVLDYIELVQPSDDGVEFFGGTVNAKHILIIGAGDDSMDWTFGWAGLVQFVAVQQQRDEANRGIEADNNGGDNTLTPRSQPVISNITLVGAPDAPDGGTGIVLRRGTGATIWNAAVTNFSACLDLDDAETFRHADEDMGISFRYTYLSCGLEETMDDEGNAFEEEDGDAFDIGDWFLGQTGNSVNRNVGLTDPTNASPNFAPVDGSVLLGAGATPPIDFFDDTDFIGAIGATDWTRSGWTILNDTTVPGTGVSANLPAEITCANGVCTVPAGTYTADMTWGPDNIFEISVAGDTVANVVIGDGTAATTLTVLPGTEVRASGRTAIVIAQNSMIMAEGTAESPITFTSPNQTRGAWGGIIINGNAPVNCGAPCSGEGSSGDYGGMMAEESSGVLKYVRIRYAGVRITDEDEFNGLALQGVGSGTEIDYIELLQPSDDGVEFFGGAVNAKHLLILGAGDDSVDWTFGWNGNVQYVAVRQAADESNRGIEADNNGGDNTLVPRSQPVFSNMTLVGAPLSPDADSGITLRRGTGATIWNTVVTNFVVCLDLDDAETFRHASEDMGIQFQNTVLSCY